MRRRFASSTGGHLAGRRSRRLGLVAAVVAASLTFGAAASANQSVEGTVLLPAPAPDPARALYLSAGQNGVSGYVFAVAPETVGTGFVLETRNILSAELADDPEIHFYSDFSNGMLCGSYATNGQTYERGVVCGEYAVVIFKNRASARFAYETERPTVCLRACKARKPKK